MPTKLPPAKSVGEETLAIHLRADGLTFEREYQFHPERKWRADFVVRGEFEKIGPQFSILVEIDGGNRKVVKGVAVGYHGSDADYEKLNEAAILGWKVLRFTPAQVKSGKAIDTIKRALGVENAS